MGHNGCKTMSLGHILEKAYVGSGIHVIFPICLKVGHNVCLDDILKDLKKSHVGSKTKLLGQIFKTNLVYTLGATFLSLHS